jgi:hypothetical protein
MQIVSGGIEKSTLEVISTKKEKSDSSASKKQVEVILNFKKFIFCSGKKMFQD